MSEHCGHPTQGGDGPPCQHPTTDDGDPDRCWIPDHNDADVDTEAGGRKWGIQESDHDDILEAAELGASKAGCARAAGVSKSQLSRYLEEHDEFRNAFARARAQGEQRLLTEPLFQDDDPNAPDIDGQHARFLLSTSFDYTKTEKHEVDADVDQSGELSININRDVVTHDDE